MTTTDQRSRPDRQAKLIWHTRQGSAAGFPYERGELYPGDELVFTFGDGSYWLRVAVTREGFALVRTDTHVVVVDDEGTIGQPERLVPEPAGAHG